ncbi:MAG: 6-carboxytetrahydropterin synthase [Deltaproteobacteria bacterium]|nr:6-carboxytetrahydropterin synthase [Deltaproteobacteria bacterium]
MYEITVTRYFTAKHGLRNFKGGDEPIHEHEWRVDVTLTSSTVDASGCVADFHDVDRAIDEAIAPFRNHSFNDIPPFDRVSPSAENIARHLFDALFPQLATGTCSLHRIAAWEDATHCATYTTFVGPSRH